MGRLGELGLPPLHRRLDPSLLAVVGPAGLPVFLHHEVGHEAAAHAAPALDLHGVDLQSLPAVEVEALAGHRVQLQLVQGQQLPASVNTLPYRLRGFTMLR